MIGHREDLSTDNCFIYRMISSSQVVLRSMILRITSYCYTCLLKIVHNRQRWTLCTILITNPRGTLDCDILVNYPSWTCIFTYECLSLVGFEHWKAMLHGKVPKDIKTWNLKKTHRHTFHCIVHSQKPVGNMLVVRSRTFHANVNSKHVMSQENPTLG